MTEPNQPYLTQLPHPEAPLAVTPRIVVVDLTALDIVKELNASVFGEERVINTFDREDLYILLAYLAERPIAFKIGYRESRFVYYSAKGGVLPEFRRMGIARRMLHEMTDLARAHGFIRFAFDTFPNRHPGMTILGLKEGFRVVKADYNTVYRDFRLRFEKSLKT
jgi:GNAT superfamily N-acetyltransferase